MPNWCANRLIVTGSKEQLDAVEAFALGEMPHKYEMAIKQSIRLFVAGCAGLLQTVDGSEYTPYLDLTSTGRGVISPENLAFTEWVTLLLNNVELDDTACTYIDRLYGQSGIGDKTWETLPDAAQETIESLFKEKGYDWFNCTVSGTSPSYSEYWDLPLSIDNGQPFDMRSLLPTRLANEVNGFNGRLLANISSSCSLYLSLYEVKWPTACSLDVFGETCELTLDFDTPWGPPSNDVLSALSRQFDCDVMHYFSESGCGFCGYGEYSKGDLLDGANDNIEFEEFMGDDGYEYSREIGPDYIIDNLPHFGG
ncbi:DUF1281 domain-containing protein [Yersinia enterocolitica]|nr:MULTISPECIES: DUF1281 domain-containing protein [Yersinia]MCB5310550.1 DUF1281 domain-containing protein [Yersinia massiliensis]HEI6730748.1 DUF1281 domain-containing protein [Yersinia enterocolitica]HEI6857210.1 DUF1281 domain-containing protein [Yersinia enterocolitica]